MCPLVTKCPAQPASGHHLINTKTRLFIANSQAPYELHLPFIQGYKGQPLRDQFKAEQGRGSE